MKSLIRMIPWIMGGLGFVFMFIVGPYFSTEIYAGAPIVADPASGRVVEFNQHGVLLYLTEKEQFLLEIYKSVGIVMIAVAGLAWKQQKSKEGLY